MNCKGIYKYERKEVLCLTRWSCKNFSIHKSKDIPKSETGECDYYEPTYGTT